MTEEEYRLNRNQLNVQISINIENSQWRICL